VFVTSHVLAGALIGRAASRNPIAAFAVGLISHVAMDSCPHWGIKPSDPGFEKQFMRVAKCDGCAGLAAMALAAGLAPGSSRAAVFAGMVGAALPDADKPIEYFFGTNPFPAPVRRFHQRIQREAQHRLPHEVVAVAALAAAALLVLPRSGRP
jgi:hypothetical protein